MSYLYFVLGWVIGTVLIETGKSLWFRLQDRNARIVREREYRRTYR